MGSDNSKQVGPSTTKGQDHRLRAESPGSSCLSLKSDRSMRLPPVFSKEPGPSHTKCFQTSCLLRWEPGYVYIKEKLFHLFLWGTRRHGGCI
ncbi:unnamed protein product [Pleuronectes platessa]|uniref:Uncharacterized protein n=1 Tax=Pleuronectes platessa TaxID=8262 RepID=A0A9N7UJX8_PLEPL|nr:unnamed protein product [Pleuronectes platessa]